MPAAVRAKGSRPSAGARFRRLALAGSATALACAVAHAGPAGDRRPQANLLLITIDTLRADRLHAYGYASIETPATDRLAREGVLVEDAVVHVPQTGPSHASLFTGRLPIEHGVRDNYSPPLAAQHPTLASLLQGHGYDTAGFIGALPVSAHTGLDRGFALYEDPFSARGEGTLLVRNERRGDEVVAGALNWLARPRERPFFAWVHLYDPHAPYSPPAPYDRRYAGRPYDGEVAFADAQVGRLLDYLDARGLRRSTLVVVTSDHGEGLGEHGEEEHLLFVYDSTLRVPLLVSWPEVLPAASRVQGQFRGVDLLPTLVELLGLPEAPGSGTSRAQLLVKGGRIPDNECYVESLFGSLHFGYAPLHALRAEGWKLIDAPRPELYQLRDDAGETRNLVDERSLVASRLRQALSRHLQQDRPGPAMAPAADSSVLERLAALGYVGGGVSRSGASRGADPKDKVGEYQEYTRTTGEALRLVRQNELDRALPLLERLAQGEIASFEVEHALGRVLLRKRRYREAVKPLQNALALMPRSAQAHIDLATAYRRTGRTAEARVVLARGLEADPHSVPLLMAEAELLLGLRQVAEAGARLEQARNLAPGNPRVRLALSAVYRERGELERAATELREAVQAAPAFSAGWHALGLILKAQGKDEPALEAFRRSLELSPKDPDVLFNTAQALRLSHQVQEALLLLERLVAQAPGYPGAREALEAARRDAAPTPAGLLRLRLLRVSERSVAEAVARRLAEGTDFAALAREVSVDPSASRGGDLGVLSPRDLAEPLRTVAAGLQVGEVSAILETASGLVILKREP